MYASQAQMDDVEDNSDSDQELDNQELEVALYSQIHFDSGTQAEQWLNSNNYSYLSRSTSLRIGVKELPVRTRSSLKQPVFDGEFIAFSQSKSADDEGSIVPQDLASSRHGRNQTTELEISEVELEIVKSKYSDVEKQTFVLSSASDTLKSSVKCHRDSSHSTEANKHTNSWKKSQVKSPVLEYKIDSKKYALNSIPKDLTDINQSQNAGGKHNKLIKQEIGKSPPKVKNLKENADIELSTPKVKNLKENDDIELSTPKEKKLKKNDDIELSTPKVKNLKENNDIELSTPKVKKLKKNDDIELSTPKVKNLKKNNDIELSTPKVKNLKKNDHIELSTPKVKNLKKNDHIELSTPKVKNLKKNDDIELSTPKVKNLKKNNDIELSTPKVKNLKKNDDIELKENASCLPFSVTKTIKKRKVADTECGDTEQETVETQPTPPGKRKATNTPAKLESFLELPKSGTVSSVKQLKNKRASLSKTDAAVKPRTPKFFLRRPPATVVKYRQDSDTNTDYSESDTSISSSPVKGNKNSSKGDTGINSSPVKGKKNSSKGDTSISSSPVKGKKNTSKGDTSISSSPVKGNKNTSKDASLLDSTFVSEDTTARTIKTTHKLTDVDTGDSSDIPVLAEHQRGQFGMLVGSKPDRATTSLHDVSVSSEDESETDEVLQTVLVVESSFEDGSSQEESTSESEDTDSSDPEEFVTETIPGLEFNLERGAAAEFDGKDPNNWKINEKDRLSINTTLNRYFFPRSIQCRNCKGEGHLSRDCPKPLKRRCIFCGSGGHSFHACPDAVCFNCSAPGHKVNKCKEQKIHWTRKCDRCWMSGHEEKKCPDRWRQYHITVSPKGSRLAAANKDVKNPLVFCYNCGKKGHLGYECKMPRMNKFTTAPYPFVAHYDSKDQRQEMRRGRTGVSDSPGPSGLTDKSKKQSFNQMKNKGFDRDKQRHFKDQKRIQESEDEYTYGTKKRRRSNHKMANEQRANSKTKGAVNERNSFTGQGHKTTFLRDQRSDIATSRRQEMRNEEAMDAIFNDFGKHQVNDNEWWNRNGKPAKKKRKRHSNIFDLDIYGDDWQTDRPDDRKVLLMDKDTSTFQGNQSHRFDAKMHAEGWKKNRPQQRSPGKQRHRDFLPEFQFNQHGDFSPEFQFNHQTGDSSRNSRMNSYKKHEVGDFSNNKPSQEYIEFCNKVSNRFKTQHADFQKPGSDFQSRQGGFQVRNDRFVAMKKNHNITVSFRK